MTVYEELIFYKAKAERLEAENASLKIALKASELGERLLNALADLPEDVIPENDLGIYTGPDPYTTRGAMAETSPEAAMCRLGMNPDDPQN